MDDVAWLALEHAALTYAAAAAEQRQALAGELAEAARAFAEAERQQLDAALRAKLDDLKASGE